MSKKDKRIKKLEQLNADMAIECDEMETTIYRLHGSNIKMIDGLLRIREERDSIRHDLGECQAGREALQRYIDDLAPVAVWKAHAKETAAYADEMKAENAELLEKLHVAITTATNWEERFFNGEQLIINLQSENAELKERLENIKFFLSDGDEG